MGGDWGETSKGWMLCMLYSEDGAHWLRCRRLRHMVMADPITPRATKAIH
jgi:hypothetical protein